MNTLKNIILNPIFITLLVILLGIGALVLALSLGSSNQDVGEASMQERFWGKEDAKVVVRNYSDFRCSHCKDFHQTTEKDLKDKYGDRIKYVFMHNPILDGPESGYFSTRAAEAAEAAGEEGKFWEYIDILFKNQTESSEWDNDRLTEYAKEIGLNSEEFEKKLSGDRYRSVILEYREIAKDKGYNSTPTVTINDELIQNPSFEDLVNKIDKELAKVGDDQKYDLEENNNEVEVKKEEDR